MSKKYFIQEETLTDIADSVRALTGSTETLNMSEINTKISQSAEINNSSRQGLTRQSSLIAEIQNALQEKKGETSGVALENTTLTIESDSPYWVAYSFLNSQGVVESCVDTEFVYSSSIECLLNSVVIIYCEEFSEVNTEGVNYYGDSDKPNHHRVEIVGDEIAYISFINSGDGPSPYSLRNKAEEE